MVLVPAKFSAGAKDAVASDLGKDSAVLVVNRNVGLPMFTRMIHGENNAGVGLQIYVELHGCFSPSWLLVASSMQPWLPREWRLQASSFPKSLATFLGGPRPLF